LGVLLDRLKRFDEARVAYLQTLRANPDQPDVRAHLGKIFLGLGFKEQAVHELAVAVASPNAKADWTTSYGRALVEIGEVAAALQVFRRATLKRDPAGAFELGRLLDRKRLYLEAAQAFGISATMGSLGPEAYYNQGTMLMNAEHYREAEVAFRRALLRDPAHPRTIYNLAVLFIKDQRYEEARTQIERVRLSGQDVSSLEAALPSQ
jgi:Flp pilus assembly protein TadD